MVTDSDGEVVAQFEYGAFGEILDGSVDEVPGGMPYLWVGGLGVRFDNATGLYYMRHRWYSNEVMRFLNRDPLGLVGGSNMYAYVRNPVKFVDPLGLRKSYFEGSQVQTFEDALGILREAGGDFSEVAGLLGAMSLKKAKSISVE